MKSIEIQQKRWGIRGKKKSTYTNLKYNTENNGIEISSGIATGERYPKSDEITKKVKN